jgi:metal-responsive CopG/Arc/MetJ family transcriptional regulator
MSTQIAVRLPDDMVAYVDDLVHKRGAGSRAAVVVQALKLYRMRLTAERDARILEQTGDYDDLEGLSSAVALDD